VRVEHRWGSMGGARVQPENAVLAGVTPLKPAQKMKRPL